LDDDGDVEIQSREEAAKITVKADGSVLIEAGTGGAKIDVTTSGELHLNASDGAVVTTDHICSYTGYGHPEGSSTVKAQE
jgi:hypothetical protein